MCVRARNLRASADRKQQDLPGRKPFNRAPPVKHGAMCRHRQRPGEFNLVGQFDVRGPQYALYRRNATAGVVNVISVKPTDQFEAIASTDIGNYQNRRLEVMVNIPLVDDRVDLRVAGE